MVQDYMKDLFLFLFFLFHSYSFKDFTGFSPFDFIYFSFYKPPTFYLHFLLLLLIIV